MSRVCVIILNWIISKNNTSPIIIYKYFFLFFYWFKIINMSLKFGKIYNNEYGQISYSESVLLEGICAFKCNIKYKKNLC